MNIVNLFNKDGFIDGLQLKKYKSQYKPISDSFSAKNLGFYVKVIGPKEKL